VTTDIYGGYTCEALFGEAVKLEPSVRQQMEILPNVVLL